MFAEQTSPGGKKLPAECLTHISCLLANIPSLPGPSDGAAGAKRMGEPGKGPKGSFQGSTSRGGTRDRLHKDSPCSWEDESA